LQALYWLVYPKLGHSSLGLGVFQEVTLINGYLMMGIILELMGLLALLTAILVITALNPILAVVYLIGVFLCAAAYLALIGLGFLALVYLIIYVGALAILFLFVVMMLDIKIIEWNALSGSRPFQRDVIPLAFALALLFTLLFKLIWSDPDLLVSQIESSALSIAYNPYCSVWPSLFESISQVQLLGIILYSALPLWLIILGVILLLAIIGPILLSV
jgi:NADH-ubiquinone oxidoreductase chain 6